ncbi:three prime repair exonuclease 4 [Poeciliopsis prolifica]|uniref:three prime repair exonuclease 4 n=1 Tax=Poeciliopsis prolifica TaxID=188132 RepID=UPI00241341F2|nr:three prime repair exonuclease 4 [Poeciliopsis prolifica]
MQPETDEEGNFKQRPLVFFDLETTGLGPHCEIIQLAAVSGGHSLNLYVVPRCRIERGAARVTGFKVRGQRLYQDRRLIFTNSLREVVVSFIAFLQMLGRPLVVGHNIRNFDCPLLARALDELDLRAQFEGSVSGCVDTLPLARELLRDRGLQSFGQENLVRELLGINYRAHDALEDVRVLKILYGFLHPTTEVVSRHMFTLDTMDSKPTVPCNKRTKRTSPPTGEFQTDGESKETT